MTAPQNKSLTHLKASLKVKNFTSLPLTIEIPPDREEDKKIPSVSIQGAPKAVELPVSKPLDFVRSRSFGEMQMDKKKPLSIPSSSFSEKMMHAASDFSIQLMMPYLQYGKEKKTLYTPFKWNYDEGLARHIGNNSLFLIKEVPSISIMGSQAQDQTYQIQINKKKVETVRGQIQASFDLYYKLLFCNRIPIHYCYQINRLRKLLEEIPPLIDNERLFDYENSGEEYLMSQNIHEKVYEEYKTVLEPLLNDNLISSLIKIKKEFYAMEYLSNQHKNLKERLELLLTDINHTIRVVSTLKKEADVSKNFLKFGEKYTVKFDKVRKPRQLYNSFIDLAIQIKTLSDEANLLSKLRTSYRKYIKIIVIMEIYGSEENKMKELKRKLILLENQLRKKVESQKLEIKAFSRRTRSLVPEIEFLVEPCRVDLKKLLVDEEECLDISMTSHMKQHILAVERFVKRAELFCEELSLEKNQPRVAKMHNDASLYLEQVEKIIRGFCFTKQTMEKLRPLVESQSFGQATTEDIEKQVKKEFTDVASHIDQADWAFDKSHWDSQKVLLSLKTALEQNIMIKGKGIEKAVVLGKRNTLAKLAKIIRERQQEKSRIYISCQTRVENFVNVEDILKFFKSKKLWQSIASPQSHLVSIRNDIIDQKKDSNKKIHCNPDLEAYLWTIIRSFINALSDPTHKRLP